MQFSTRATEHQYVRTNVVGTSGSGKSTFAKALAAKLGHPYVEMDQLFWLPDWTMTPDDLFFSKLTSAIAGERWVLDGNYDRTIPIKWSRTTAVIWIDYSFGRTLVQAVVRATKRALDQRELWSGTGNRESFRRSFFSRNSIIWWTITTFKQNRAKYAGRMSDPAYAHLHFVRLRSPGATKHFLNSLSASSLDKSV